MVSATGITDFKIITAKMAELFMALGGEIKCGVEVKALRERAHTVHIELAGTTITAKYLVLCGGLMADRLARNMGIDIDFQIVPFRGEYYRLSPRHNSIVKHLVYPTGSKQQRFHLGEGLFSTVISMARLTTRGDQSRSTAPSAHARHRGIPPSTRRPPRVEQSAAAGLDVRKGVVEEGPEREPAHPAGERQREPALGTPQTSGGSHARAASARAFLALPASDSGRPHTQRAKTSSTSGTRSSIECAMLITSAVAQERVGDVGGSLHQRTRSRAPQPAVFLRKTRQRGMPARDVLQHLAHRRASSLRRRPFGEHQTGARAHLLEVRLLLPPSPRASDGIAGRGPGRRPAQGPPEVCWLCVPTARTGISQKYTGSQEVKLKT